MSNKFILNIKLLLVISSFSAVGAVKQAGDIIEYQDFKSDKFNIGDVQWSMLSETNFYAVHGTCWSKFNGAVAPPELVALGISSLPDGDGAFIRNSGGNAGAVNTLQDSEVKQHYHTQSDMNCASSSCSYETFVDPNGFLARGTRRVSATSSRAYTRYSPYTENFGGAETRPANVAMNLFVKVKEDCE